MRKLLALVAGLGLVAVGCTSGGNGLGGPAPTAPPGRSSGGGDLAFVSALRKVGGCDALLDHVRAEASSRVGPYGLGGQTFYAVGGVGIAEDAREAAPASPAVSGESSATASTTHSTTNVQEAGVDEPDIVKTDGERIVTLSNGVLSVVDATAQPATRTGSLRLTEANGMSPTDLLIAGNKALVFGTAWEQPAVKDRSGSSPDAVEGRQLATITEVDLSNAAAPAVVATLRVDGWYLTSRLTDGVARVVVRSDPTRLPFVYPQSQAGEKRAEEANRQVVEQSTLEDWLPSYELRGPDGSVNSSGQLTACEDVDAPTEFAGFGTVSVLTFDTNAPLGNGNAVSVLAGGDTVYASNDRLYVATTSYIDPDAMSRGPIEQWNRDFSTSIHAFDILGTDKAAYLGSGTVPGHLLNQFSMSEHRGLLRAASTRGVPWDEQEKSESLVTVLQLRDDKLVQVGQVGDMGRGERIYSVRYAGDVAYVVTFRQTDPFYTVDLSNPAAPRVVGELEIPGFSSYLHPIDGGLVIGVGQDASGTGRVQGTKVSLFDVSDLAAPTEVATWTLPDSGSLVEADHHAFLWWPATKQLVLPVNQWGGPNGEATPFFGAIVLHVDRDGIAEVGRVQHATVDQPGGVCTKPEPMPEPALPANGARASSASSGSSGSDPGASGSSGSGAASSESTGPGEVAVTPIEPCGPVSQPDGIQRSLVVGDDLWTLGQFTLQANALADLTPGAVVPVN